MTAGRYCQTPACVLARPKGRAKAIRWSKPLDCRKRPETWRTWVVHGDDVALIYGGSIRAQVVYLGVVTGGRLRAPAGLAVGVEPASDPVKRIMVNVGDTSRSPGCWWWLGKARCRLMGSGCVGVRVVVRGREAVHMAKADSRTVA